MAVKALALALLLASGRCIGPLEEPVAEAATRDGTSVASLSTGREHGSGEPELASLGLSRRAYNALMRAGISKPAQVMSMSRAEILAIRGVGQRTLEDMEKSLGRSDGLSASGGRSPARTRWLDRPICDLDLRTTLRRKLTEAGITTVDQLLSLDRESLLGIRGLGPKALAEIGLALDERCEATWWADEREGLGGRKDELALRYSGSVPLGPATRRVASVNAPHTDQWPRAPISDDVDAAALDMGQTVADLGRLGLRGRAFTADELAGLLVSVVHLEDLESALSADARIMSFGANQRGQHWYARKSDLFAWFCHLNLRLARAVVFELPEGQLAHAMSSLRAHGRWDTAPDACVAWAKPLGLVGDGVRVGYYVFPLARLLARMSGRCLQGALHALRWMEDNRVWEKRVSKLTGDCVRDAFSTCQPRTQRIIMRRTGLQTGAPMTLQEAGAPWGLTRERTRQLEQRFWSSLKAKAGVGRQRRKALVTAMLCDFIAHSGSLVIRIGCETQCLRTFLARCSSVPVTRLRYLGLIVLGISAEDVERVMTTDYFPRELTAGMVTKHLTQQGPLGFVREDVDVLARAVAAYRWERLKGPQRVYLALQAIGRPAHYSRIAEVHNTLFPEKAASEQSILNRLGQEKLGVVWVGARGTYALEEWGYERPSATLFDSVADIVERKYQETGRPVPYSVIVAEIGKLRPIVNQSSLTFAAHCNDRLERMDGNCFVPRGLEQGSTDEPSWEELDSILRAFQESTVPGNSAGDD